MSLTLLEQLLSSITPQLTSYAAKLLGETPAATDKAIAAALPTILSGIAAATRLPSGLPVIHRLVHDPVNDGTLLHQLPALYQGTMTAAPVYRLGTQLLQGIFGRKQSQVTQTIAVLASVKPTAAAQLVSTLAPHVLSVIGERQRASAASTPASLAALLDAQSASITNAMPTSLGQIFGAPGVARAAAGAATAASASGLTTVAARAGGAAITTTAATGTARASRSPAGGLAPWMIFPLGLIVGTGLVGLGSLIGNGSGQRGRDPVVVATEPLPAAVPTPPAAAAPPKVAEMKPVAVPAPPVAAPPIAAAPASKPAAKTVQKPADPKPAPTVKAAEPASAKAAKPDPAAAGSAASKVQPPPGVTTYFGQTPALGEIQARPNPDYKPAIQSVEPNTAAVAAVVAATPPASVPVASVPVVEALPPPLPVGPPGVTSFFGEGKATSEMIAVANPDYKPAPPIAAVIDQPPARPALVEPPRQPSIPGITTFFGTKAGPAEQSAKPNPDYKPAPADVVAAPPPVAPMTPAAAVPAPPAVASSTGVEVCRTAVADAVKSGTVLFKSAKADLKSTSLPTLDAIAAAFKSCPDARLRIEGHTDNSGLADMNQKLSEARAQAVSSFLVGKGIEANRISAAGFGLSRPLVPNSTPANKARNRRIEFIVDAL